MKKTIILVSICLAMGLAFWLARTEYGPPHAPGGENGHVVAAVPQVPAGRKETVPVSTPVASTVPAQKDDRNAWMLRASLDGVLAACNQLLKLPPDKSEELRRLVLQERSTILGRFAEAAQVKLLNDHGVVLRVQLSEAESARLENSFYDRLFALNPEVAPSQSEIEALRTKIGGFFEDFGAHERIFAFTSDTGSLADARVVQFEKQGTRSDQVSGYGFQTAGTLFGPEFRSVFGPLATLAIDRDASR